MTLHIAAQKPVVSEITPKKATHGKTTSGNEKENAAGHAIDKDLSSRALTETKNGAGWLELEFDKTHFIHSLTIYSRFYTGWYSPSGMCVKKEADFKECVDRNTDVDVSVYQGNVKQKSCGTLQLSYRLEQLDQIYTLICNVMGDKVRLSKTSGKIAVYEVVVTGTGKL
jgi:hypothetical protein